MSVTFFVNDYYGNTVVEWNIANTNSLIITKIAESDDYFGSITPEVAWNTGQIILTNLQALERPTSMIKGQNGCVVVNCGIDRDRLVYYAIKLFELAWEANTHNTNIIYG